MILPFCDRFLTMGIGIWEPVAHQIFPALPIREGELAALTLNSFDLASA